MKAFHSGFTLVEILIVTALIGLISSTIPVTINFRQQIARSNDAKRKNDLSALSKVFEEFFNDRISYPVGTDICFDAVQVDPETSTCTCHVCGKESSQKLQPYLNQQLSCDPLYPNKNYIYQYDCSQPKPSWYRMCALLQLSDTGASLPNDKYNYGIASPNVSASICNTIPFSYGVPTPTPTTFVPPTSTPVPTSTPIPTSAPTYTPAPTSTPVPTATTAPTYTPIPTNTPTTAPPTATPTSSCSCSGRVCGLDSCGIGSCGSCGIGQTCSAGGTVCANNPTNTPTPTRTPTPSPTPICYWTMDDCLRECRDNCYYNDRMCDPRNAAVYCGI